MCKRKAILLLLIAFLLTGCWDKVEIEDRAHISAVGIDKYNPSAEEDKIANVDEETTAIKETNDTGRNKYVFTFSFPNETKEEVTDIVISTVGDALYSVSRIMSDRTNKELFLGHLRTVIIGADIAKDSKSFREILDGIENNELLSRRVVLAMTDDSAGDIIKVKPSMQPRVGQFISEIFRRRDRTPRSPSGSIGDILKDLHETGNALIPRITAGKTDVKVAGAGVISNYQFKGWLGEVETAHLMLLKGETSILGGTAVNYKGHSIPIDMRPQKPKMHLIENENNIKILIEIEAEADVKQTYFESKEDMLKIEVIKEVEELANREIKGRIEETIYKVQKEFATDVIGVDRFLRQRHYSLWKSVEKDWRDIFPNIDIEVKMDVKIRRIGLVR